MLLWLVYIGRTRRDAVADAEGLRISSTAESDVDICMKFQAAHFDLRRKRKPSARSRDRCRCRQFAYVVIRRRYGFRWNLDSRSLTPRFRRSMPGLSASSEREDTHHDPGIYPHTYVLRKGAGTFFPT
jgi:hypothetical protein